MRHSELPRDSLQEKREKIRKLAEVSKESFEKAVPIFEDALTRVLLAEKQYPDFPDLFSNSDAAKSRTEHLLFLIAKYVHAHRDHDPKALALHVLDAVDTVPTYLSESFPKERQGGLGNLFETMRQRESQAERGKEYIPVGDGEFSVAEMTSKRDLKKATHFLQTCLGRDHLFEYLAAIKNDTYSLYAVAETDTKHDFLTIMRDKRTNRITQALGFRNADISTVPMRRAYLATVAYLEHKHPGLSFLKSPLQLDEVLLSDGTVISGRQYMRRLEKDDSLLEKKILSAISITPDMPPSAVKKYVEHLPPHATVQMTHASDAQRAQLVHVRADIFDSESYKYPNLESVGKLSISGKFRVALPLLKSATSIIVGGEIRHFSAPKLETGNIEIYSTSLKLANLPRLEHGFTVKTVTNIFKKTGTIPTGTSARNMPRGARSIAGGAYIIRPQ